MTRLLMLVEGITERQFVTFSLVPHLANHGVYCIPTTVTTRANPAGPDNKGGFVMNMLRTYARHLTGSKKKGDALFKQAIRNFIDEFYLKFPSNLDMQKSLSRSFGTDLSWFFKQWVYGMGIPKVEFSYELSKHPDGGTLLRGRVKQRQAGKAFKFPVAVYVRKGKGKKAEEAHFYQMIETADETFEVGPLPWPPTEVTLNDDLGVLAIVEPVDWQGTATGM